jgi:predicted HicB family RNase H-like nuclease
MARRRGSGGRPSKGPRIAFTTRVPESLGDVISDAADDAGLSLNDYIAGVLAHAHGLPAPAHTDTRQEELQLSKTA